MQELSAAIAGETCQTEMNSGRRRTQSIIREGILMYKRVSIHIHSRRPVEDLYP